MRLVGKPLLKSKEDAEMVIRLEKGQGDGRRGQDSVCSEDRWDLCQDLFGSLRSEKGGDEVTFRIRLGQPGPLLRWVGFRKKSIWVEREEFSFSA